MSLSSNATITTEPTSNLFLDGTNTILSTLLPEPHHQQGDDLYTAIGVKSHGTITFPDNRSARAEFIRIPRSAPTLPVKDLLNKHWCKERPSLVISITGGAKDFKMKSELLRVLRRGLLKVARTTGAWIITGGTNTGIMKIVGDLVQINPDRSRPIHLIGIATWGCVSNGSKLDVQGSNVHYGKPRVELKGEAPLEPNHTEFIFVDDGTERVYGGEIEFRARLEKAISGDFFMSRASINASNQASNLAANQVPRPELPDTVPVVLLVVEGGPNTVKTVREAVVQNNIPAVFLEGTGRCCDLFGKAYRLYKEYLVQFELAEEPSELDPETEVKRIQELKSKLREELEDQLRAVSGTSEAVSACAGSVARTQIPRVENKKNNVQDLDKLFELVYECVNTRIDFLNVLSLNSQSSVEPDIDLAILRALLNATSNSSSGKTNYQRKREQFLLALEWKRVDIANNYIMKTSCDWEKVDLSGVFELALHQDQADFVELFLKHDFSLTDAFHDQYKLASLYTNSLKEKDESFEDGFDSLDTVYRHQIQPLIGDFFDVDVAFELKNARTTSWESGLYDDEPCTCCMASWTSQHYHSETYEEPASVQIQRPRHYCETHMDMDKELFLWSVVTGKRDFNFLFWSRGKNKICAALIATLIYKQRRHKKHDHPYIKATAHEFENLAVQILDKFYRANPRKCLPAIIRQIPAYGNVTWLQLAIAGPAKQFIAHQAVQEVLNKIWYGVIDRRVSSTKIILSTLIPGLSGLLRYHDIETKADQLPTSSNKLFREVKSSKSKLYKRSRTSLNKFMNGFGDGHRNSLSFVDVGCYERLILNVGMRTSTLRYFQNVLRFMHAPYVKYLYNMYFHVFFLSLFSYVMLCEFFPLYPVDMSVCPVLSGSDKEPNDNHQSSTTNNTNHLNKIVPDGFAARNYPSIAEWTLFFWVFTLLSEEVRQFVNMEAQTLRNAFAAYFKVFWNKLDIFAITLFYIGFTLRFLPPTECFCAARIILSVDLTLWFIRSLDMFEVVKRLGPKLVMIGEMATDFKFFLLLLTVFILGFGVSIYSILYGSKVFSWHIPRKIINLAYWQMFGELNALDTFEHNYTPNGYAAFILLVAYMSIVSILLVNLLIAMFSFTFDHLQNDTDRIWKFQRYFLVCEYLARPSLPPPFMIISHVWRLLLFTLATSIKSPWLKAVYRRHSNRTNYKIMLDERSANDIETAEDALGDEVYYYYSKISRKEVEYDMNQERVQSPQDAILSKVRVMESRIQTMNYQQNHILEYLDYLMDGLKTLGGERIRMPERPRYDAEEPFDESSNSSDRLKRPHRKDSLVDDNRHPAATDNDDSQSHHSH